MKAAKRPIHAVTTWIRRQPPKVKAFLGVVSAMTALVLLRMIVHDHDNLFVAAEAVHALGISVLIYKLTKEKTCAALMENQVMALKEKGIAAEYLSSTQATHVKNKIHEDLDSGKPSVRLMYVTPELIATKGFMLKLRKLHFPGVS